MPIGSHEKGNKFPLRRDQAAFLLPEIASLKDLSCSFPSRIRRWQKVAMFQYQI